MLIDKVYSMDLLCSYDRPDLSDSLLPKLNTTAKQTHGTIVQRDVEYVRQTGSAPEMVFISAAPGTDLGYYGGNYVYEQSAGEGQVVYVVDSGANMDHIVCIDIHSTAVLLNDSTGIRRHPLSDRICIRRDRDRPSSKRCWREWPWNHDAGQSGG
jgi:hypothetical protein